MTREEALDKVLDVLADLRVPHMVVGSLASNYHGIPRATQDVDLVVQLETTTIAEIAGRLADGFRLDRQTSFETVTGTVRHVLEMIDAAFYVELFLLSDDPYDRVRFERRQPATLGSRDTFVLTPEDVIVTKLRWARQGDRQKDLDDVRNVIAVQQESIDWDYVNEWCCRHGTSKALEDIRSSVPPL